MSNSRRDPEHQRKVIDIRRSNAAQPHKNKRKYTRKLKHPKEVTDQCKDQ